MLEAVDLFPLGKDSYKEFGLDTIQEEEPIDDLTQSNEEMI